ncbi:NADAR family protein [Actinomadura scrupuli]|uniref:NADAR family protein n=1 Tax=Actinomadura scrupuli TaxID=559629 RepID=UPI003D99156B
MSETVGEPRSVEEARACEERGERLKYVFFWGHQAARPGRIDKSCLSQWSEHPFTVEGVTYRTAEHWMMAGKARLFGDEEVLARIVAAPHPKAAKDLGRRVRGYDEETWAAHRSDIVTAGNVAKFGQDPALKEYLLGTGGRVLVEASPLDRIWGIGLPADDERAVRPSQWRGLNLLGFALMRARADLSAATR